MELLTLTEAADRCATTRKALERRIERGTLRSKLDEQGRRVIPVAELRRAGLHPRSAPASPPSGAGGTPGAPATPGAGSDPVPPAGVDLSPLLDRLERLVSENARLRMISERAESLENGERAERLRLEAELKAAREQLAALERPRRRWFRSG